MKCFLENDFLNGTLEYILPLDDSWLRHIVGSQAVTV